MPLDALKTYLLVHERLEQDRHYSTSCPAAIFVDHRKELSTLKIPPVLSFSSGIFAQVEIFRAKAGGSQVSVSSNCKIGFNE